MYDRFGNVYNIVENPNPHQLITGASGFGKTWQLCRRIEEVHEKNRKVIVLDFSFSFAKEERVKNKLYVRDFLDEYDGTFGRTKEIYFDSSKIDEVAHLLTNLLCKVAKIRSPKKHAHIEKAIENLIEIIESQRFGLSQLLAYLKLQYMRAKVKEEAKLLGEIIDSLEFVCSADFVQICLGKPIQEVNEKIDLFQLSELPPKQRKAVSEFLILLLWEMKRKKAQCFDYLIVDEIQNLNLAEDSGIAFVLREGRKFGVGAVLATQFISSLDKEAKLTLEQVANRVYLRPTNEDIREIAKELERKKGRQEEWIKILSRLKVGEAVFSGYATVNDNQKTHEITMKMWL